MGSSSSKPPEEAPTYLYRYFDAEGALLYVGVSLSAVARLQQHKQYSKEWFDLIAKITIEQFAHRGHAEAAENRAIKEEKPLYNVVGKGSKPTVKLLMALPAPLVEQIAAYRWSERLPSAQAAYRQLIAAGLAAARPPKTRLCVSSLFM